MFCCRICPNRQGVDYFKLLGLPREYSIEIKEAERNYRNLQKSYHPDKVDESDRTVPEGFSSLLNKAITVLKSPTQRAMHLLYLLDGCSIKETDLNKDPQLLLEMIEINEEIEECGNNKVCLEKQDEVNTGKLEECDSKLHQLFVDKKYLEVRKVCERMHFLERIHNTLLQKLNSI
jgi:Fe-S protein assembly co-chaperone HscB